MSETTPLIKAALNLRVGVGFDVYDISSLEKNLKIIIEKTHCLHSTKCYENNAF